MKILVIDKDDLTSQLIMSKLSSSGHEVVVESNKTAAVEILKSKWFDFIMLDPAPLSESRPIILSIWKNIEFEVKPYIALLTKNEEMTTCEAILSCNNDFLLKPLNMGDIEDKVNNAERFVDIYNFLSSRDDIPSTKGVINKEAFFQIFLSSLDRAHRYAERSLIVFVHIANYDEIRKTTTAEKLVYFDKKIAEKMTLMRRQSDVVGRIGESDYAILLQRPQYESEPLDAINRFSDVLDKFFYEFEIKDFAPRFELDLVEIPQGILHSRKSVPFSVKEQASG